MKPSSFHINGQENGAGNEVRTRDPKLGKLVLYQLSYSRQTGFFAINSLFLHPINNFY
jgi:hypothetical protein